MDLTKSKKRKISDFFGSMPTKITRYQRGNVIRIGAKAVEEPVSTEPQIPLRKNLSPVNQGTQTDGVYEINSMKKAGLKFLVSRVFNYETSRATGNHKMCSIADDHFFLKPEDEKDELEDKPCAYDVSDDDYEDEYDDSYEDDYRSGADGFNDADAHELNHPCYKALDYLTTIQEKDNKHRDKWEEKMTVLRSEKLTLSSETSTKVDQMTQYGEDNPDEDFFEGAKFMAIKILENESERQNVSIVDSDCNDSYYCDGDCPTDCHGECMKELCDRCDGTWCKCDCEPEKRTKCECGPDPDDSDSESYEYDPDDCDCYSKECDCESCKCSEIKRTSSDKYRKYQIWNSKTPGDLIKELAKKMHDVRYQRAFEDTPCKYGPGGYGWGSIGW